MGRAVEIQGCGSVSLDGGLRYKAVGVCHWTED